MKVSNNLIKKMHNVMTRCFSLKEIGRTKLYIIVNFHSIYTSTLIGQKKEQETGM